MCASAVSKLLRTSYERPYSRGCCAPAVVVIQQSKNISSSVGPNGKKTPKIKLKNSWNWLVNGYIFDCNSLTRFGYGAQWITGNGIDGNLLKSTWKNLWNHLMWARFWPATVWQFLNLEGKQSPETERMDNGWNLLEKTREVTTSELIFDAFNRFWQILNPET